VTTLSPLVINPHGESRIVSLEEACRHLGVDFSRKNHAVYRTPEEHAERHRQTERARRARVLAAARARQEADL